ncbi:type II secretion system minor pseudopilin GspK [Aquimonas sp.]|uniref:type II secretion system minor pseudopilin GspK n=1 Tax=Aquimonas sp. TaxID=1872588 RepID=UPI0037C16662
MSVARRYRQSPLRQRGVALIFAVLVLALASVIVVGMLDAGEITQARTRNSLRAEQTWQLQLGLEAWAGEALREDERQSPNFDTNADLWAQPLPPLDIPGGRIIGRLREQGGCFNINNLQRNGEPNSVQIERFERLLRILGVNPLVAAQALDFIDADIDSSAGGAEDGAHLASAPPRRAANRPMTHVSELRLLPALDAEAWTLLQPHVCALPEGTPLNLNTASPALWMSLNEAMTRRQAEILAREGRAQYREVPEINSELERLGLARLPPSATVSVISSYFVLEADIVLDDLPFTYASLLHRGDGLVTVMARTRGRL